MDEKIKNRKPATTILPDRVGDKPSWQSSNEGVHERVNFDDTLWGFELAGGAYYDTPLRVVKVKHNSRAMFAGIKVGDVLQTINDINTFTLTVQEAHDMILDSGIEIKLSFYAPDVLETMHSVYQDEINNDKTEPKEFHYFEEPVRDLSYKHVRANQAWSIIWPCNKKRDILYKESNCFLVPSAYERKHKERLLKNPAPESNGSV
ncbi:uncharacterized protein LOC114363512 [Ostrinia furnacalis]|uniref:uncharacterized protein LOC114363512 n=1 Tax=Ostrinia furnacalis TaxID=93504 RepID=UPI00103B290D|nr:uncharacterized protein LOC114363512 [Ostrinia furnacalis]